MNCDNIQSSGLVCADINFLFLITFGHSPTNCRESGLQGEDKGGEEEKAINVG